MGRSSSYKFNPIISPIFPIFRPGPPEFTEELHMRQETDGVLLECYLIYEPEHQATWFKDDQVLLGALDFDEKYQVKSTEIFIKMEPQFV